MRRSGRTTILVLEATANLFKHGYVHFKDHDRDDGRAILEHDYIDLLPRFVGVISLLLNISRQEVKERLDFRVGQNGYGVDISFDMPI